MNLSNRLHYILTYLFLSIPIISFCQHHLQVCIQTSERTKITTILTEHTNQYPVLHFTSSDTCISYLLKNTNQYSLKILADGYLTYDSTFTFMKGNPKHFVQLIPKVTQLKELLVKSKNTIKYQNDTLIISTEDIYTQPHANASELVNHIPGISLGSDGSISVFGKKLNSVTVNGQTIFGGNAKAVLDALQGEMIKQLEVVESNGSLNIKLKKEFENGAYGQLLSNLGTNSHYQYGGRINKINPKHLINSYATINTINQRAQTSQDETTYMRALYFDMLKGGYSIVDQIEATPVISIKQNDISTNPNLLMNASDGLAKIYSGGLNFSKSYSKASISGYVFGDKENRYINKNEKQITNAGDLQQNIYGRNYTFLTNSWLRGTISGMVQFSTKSTLRFSQTIGYKETTNKDTVHYSQDFINIQSSDTLTRSLLNTFQNRNQSDFTISQHLSWLRRHNKKAHFTSLYFNYFYNNSKSNHGYRNDQIIANDTSTINHNILHHISTLYGVNAQAIHALPITRTWLIEGKIISTIYTNKSNQQGDQILSNQNTIPNTGLSFNYWSVKNIEWKPQIAVVYKSVKLDFITGLRYWNLYTSRELESFYKNDIHYNISKTIPNLFIIYRLNSQNKISFKYSIDRINPTQLELFPVADSSSIQNIKYSNIYLKNHESENIELNFSTVLKESYNLSLNFQIEKISNPINTTINTTSSGWIAQSFSQSSFLKNYNASFIWININPRRSFHIFFIDFLSLRESIISYQNNLIRYRNLINAGTFGLKYNISKSTLLQIDYQFNFTKQTNKSLQSPSNIRNGINAKTEINFNNHLFLQVNANSIINKSTDNSIYFNSFLDFDLSSYLGKNNQFKISITGNNLFNSKTIFDFQQSANTWSEQSINKLPRYVSMKLTYYWSKFKFDK
ncbi:MAG: outer membrane beta-barrel protein [Siphonobacter sp.]